VTTFVITATNVRFSSRELSEETKRNKKFWKELIAYFPSSAV
jgi:hypothetical protein